MSQTEASGQTETPTTVTLTTSGVSVTITAVGDMDALTDRAAAMHREAYQRCVAAPPGLGGTL